MQYMEKRRKLYNHNIIRYSVHCQVNAIIRNKFEQIMKKMKKTQILQAVTCKVVTDNVYY